ncbi:MAG TPA: sigma factor [Candidatus Saccharimonadales bacterium]|nr:sigma factor [Candidatus Saccharimonadales bacterium]
MDEAYIYHAFEKLQHLYSVAHDIPVLTIAEENKLFLELKSNPEVKIEIAESNLRKVADLANAYFIRHGLELDVDVDELIHAGNVGLMLAIPKYDIAKATAESYRFADYAAWWIKKEMSRYIASLK